MVRDLTPYLDIAFSGVYFLRKEKKLLYIGQSVNVIQRVMSHFNDPRRPIIFDDAKAIPCPKEDLRFLEGALIRLYRPEINVCSKADLHFIEFVQIKKYWNMIENLALGPYRILPLPEEVSKWISTPPPSILTDIVTVNPDGTN